MIDRRGTVVVEQIYNCPDVDEFRSGPLGTRPMLLALILDGSRKLIDHSFVASCLTTDAVSFYEFNDAQLIRQRQRYRHKTDA